MKVEDVFELNSKMKNLKLLAGKKGLGNDIKDIGVLEVPDGVLWSRKDELVITTGYFIFKKEIELVDVIKILKEKNAVGLGIKTDRFLKSIPKEAIELAEKYNFPFFEIPIYLGYNDFIWPIISNLLGEEDYINYRLMKYNEDILKESVKNYYLKNIADILAKHINSSFIIISEAKQRVLVESLKGCQIEDKDIKDIITQNKETIIANNNFFKDNTLNNDIYIFPLKTAINIVGYLCLIQQGSINEIDLKIINRTIPYLVISMINDSYSSNIQYDCAESFLKDLIFNSNFSRVRLSEQASYFSITDNEKRILFILNIESNQQNNDIAMIVRYLKEKLPNSYIIVNLNQIICIEKSMELLSRHDVLFNIILSDLKTIYSKSKITIAVSEVFNCLLSLKQAYKEAVFCLKLANEDEESKVYQFKYHIVDNLLYELKNNKHLNRVYSEYILKLKQYDSKQQSSYYNTLSEYLKCDGNVIKTAQNLFIHRNTLYKRLKKIEEILQIDLENHNTKLLLNMCCRYDGLMRINNEQ